MDRSLVGATLIGAAFGLGTYWFLVANWFLVTAIAALYAGAAYFRLAFDASLLGRAARFDDRTHEVGYAIGLVGASTAPIAVAQSYGADVGFPVAVLIVGVVAFLDLASKARERADGAP